MPRYVVLEHECPQGVHWDFMLEVDNVLRTWSLPFPPDERSTMTAEALADHRPAYLDYEGPVSANRGSVSRWDVGTYRLDRQSETRWEIELQGAKLRGRVHLVRLEEPPSQWRFVFSPTGK